MLGLKARKTLMTEMTKPACIKMLDVALSHPTPESPPGTKLPINPIRKRMMATAGATTRVPLRAGMILTPTTRPMQIAPGIHRPRAVSTGKLPV